jgi:hypothetical protein
MRSLKLDEIFDDEPVESKEANPCSIRKLILDRLAIVERRETEVVGNKPRRHRPALRVEAYVPEWSRHTKGDETSRPQYPRRFL